jgi:hypothetical protein
MRNLPSFAHTKKLFISIISAGSQSTGDFSLVGKLLSNENESGKITINK